MPPALQRLFFRPPSPGELLTTTSAPQLEGRRPGAAPHGAGRGPSGTSRHYFFSAPTRAQRGRLQRRADATAASRLQRACAPAGHPNASAASPLNRPLRTRRVKSDKRSDQSAASSRRRGGASRRPAPPHPSFSPCSPSPLPPIRPMHPPITGESGAERKAGPL